MEIKTVSQLIQHLATKAGIDGADQHLISILSNADISKIPIHSELATGIDNALLSITQAKDNHPLIKAKYFSEAMNGLDKKMEELMTAEGLSEEKVAELKGEKNTYKRFELLQAALKESVTAKAAAGEDKSALQKQVDDLLASARNAKKEHEAALAKVESDRRNDRISYELKGMLGSSKTVFDELPGDAKAAALNSIITKALQDKGASFDFGEDGSFILKGKEDTAVVGANSTKYTPQTFIDEVLAQNKVLKVSEQSNIDPSGQKGNSTTQRTTTVDAGDKALQGNNQTTANLNRRNREAALANFK